MEGADDASLEFQEASLLVGSTVTAIPPRRYAVTPLPVPPASGGPESHRVIRDIRCQVIGELHRGVDGQLSMKQLTKWGAGKLNLLPVADMYSFQSYTLDIVYIYICIHDVI